MGKKIVKVLVGILLLLSLAMTVLYLIYNEPLPKGVPGEDADALALNMLHTLNHQAYERTQLLEWSFAGGKHHYVWAKHLGKVQVKWDDFEVDLHLNQQNKSSVFKNGVPVDGMGKTQPIATALSFFNNDSFWLVAPFKVFDPGTERRLVSMKDGTQGLLVTYTAGGSTPGDSYLWKLGANGFPESFKIWVKIIPIGGLEATWDDWKIMESGAFLPTSHQLGFVTLSMGNVKAYNP